VDENVLAAALWRDESETLCRVEELDCTFLHLPLPLLSSHRGRHRAAKNLNPKAQAARQCTRSGAAASTFVQAIRLQPHPPDNAIRLHP
jgi:hypothetical protein